MMHKGRPNVSDVLEQHIVHSTFPNTHVHTRKVAVSFCDFSSVFLSILYVGKLD